MSFLSHINIFFFLKVGTVVTMPIEQTKGTVITVHLHIRAFYV